MEVRLNGEVDGVKRVAQRGVGIRVKGTRGRSRGEAEAVDGTGELCRAGAGGIVAGHAVSAGGGEGIAVGGDAGGGVECVFGNHSFAGRFGDAFAIDVNGVSHGVALDGFP